MPLACHHHAQLRAGAIHQLAQVAGGGAIVRLHQQAKQLLQQRLVGSQLYLAHAEGLRVDEAMRVSLRQRRVQQQRLLNDAFQRVIGCPANRGVQAQLPPLGCLALEHLPKTQRKAPARALVTMHRRGKGHTRERGQPAGQHSCWECRGLIHQQQRPAASQRALSQLGIEQVGWQEAQRASRGRQLHLMAAALRLRAQHHDTLEQAVHRAGPGGGDQ